MHQSANMSPAEILRVKVDKVAAQSLYAEQTILNKHLLLTIDNGCSRIATSALDSHIQWRLLTEISNCYTN